MLTRPVTTLFMLASVDGKICTGAGDALDADRDLPLIPGVREGLHQYYDIEKTTDLWSLNTGRVMEKIGANTRGQAPPKSPVSFVIVDNKPHLNAAGLTYLCEWLRTLVLVTTNPAHPAFAHGAGNLHTLLQKELDMAALLHTLHTQYNVQRITVQSGGRLNGLLLRQKLLDYVDVVLAPVLVGGGETPTLIDGPAITSPAELGKLGVLRLEQCDVLRDSYLRLRYKVVE